LLSKQGRLFRFYAICLNFVKKTGMSGKQRILITGAGGFLGTALAEKLLQLSDTEVVAACHHPEKCPDFNRYPAFHKVSFDICREQETAAVIKEWKPEIIFHLAAVARLQAGQKDPEKAIDVNVYGTIYLLQQAAKNGTKKFLFTSSDLAREAQSVTGISKLLSEHYLRLFPGSLPETIVFRMPNLYGFPGSVTDIFSKQIAENKDLTITDERMARRFISREEAVDYLLYLKEKGKSHQIYSVKQEPVFIKELASEMIKASGKDLKIKIIGAKPGEKLYQASYSDREAVNTGFRHLAQLQLVPPSPATIFSCIRRLPVSQNRKAALQNRFTRLF
jgi:FlaA1/EpsC-like NDP-sugar epimerase